MMEEIPEFSEKQWEFLATLAVFSEPVSVDLVLSVCELPAGQLLDVIERAEQLRLIERRGSNVFDIGGNIPAPIQKHLEEVNDGQRCSSIVERLDNSEARHELSAQAWAGLLEKAGRNEQAGLFELRLADHALEEKDLEKAYHHLLRGLSLLSFLLDGPGIDVDFVTAAINFSNICFVLGKNLNDVANFLGMGAEIAERLGDRRSYAITKLHLGRIYYFGDRRHDALDAFDEGLAIVEELGDDDILTESAEFKGFYYFMKGLHNQAIELLDRATQILEHKEGIVLFNPSAPLYLGYSACYLGQLHRAVGCLDYFWRKANSASNKVMASIYRAALGTVLLQINKPEEAVWHLDGALEEAVASRNALAKYTAKGGLAYLHYVNKDYLKARNTLEDLIEEGAKAGIKHQFASPYILEMLSEFEMHGLKPINRFRFHDQVERILRDPSVHLRGVGLRLKAKEGLKKGADTSLIREYLDESEKCLKSSGDPVQLAKTQVEMAKLKLAQGKRNEAQALTQLARRGLAGYSDKSFPDELRFLLEGKGRDATHREDVAKSLLGGLERIMSPAFSLDYKENLKYLISELNSLIGAERGGLFWREGSRSKHLHLLAVCNLSQAEAASPAFASSMELVRRALQTRSPLIKRSSQPEPARPGQGVFAAKLCLPLEIEGQVRGVFYHDNSYLPDCFDTLSESLLVRVCAQLSSWLEKAKHFTEAIRETKRMVMEETFPLETGQNEDNMIARSPVMVKALELADRAARSDSNILIQGETGVGKELLAKRLHRLSPRCRGPFVTVDPTTIPENLVESELFGYEKGAFTGADSRKLGRVELAHEGTLFIDEIGEIPIALQVKLLRVLQERTFMRVGGMRTHLSDFRLVAATNRNLEEEVASGRFRADLYYRLNIVNLRLPPLRERPDDVVPLAEEFLARISKKYNRPKFKLSQGDKEKLVTYHWPGNVRELRNIIERVVILSSGDLLELSVPTLATGILEHPFLDNPTLDEVQRRYIRYVLDKTGGRIAGTGGAAAVLGMKRTSVHTRMKKLNMKRP
jgi:transcriptional regulator with GAF, ATPase, and Fis domain